MVLRDLEVLKYKRRNAPFNLTQEEFNTLQQLQSDPDITIKPADKGGGIVVLNTEDYRNEVLRQLNDRKYYKPVNYSCINEIIRVIRIVIHEGLGLGYINNNEAAFLENKYPRIPHIYILPKIHKPDRPPIGRPIISQCGSFLEPLAKFIDFHFQKLLPTQDTLLKDTTHFINLIEKLRVPKGAVLMTMDVTSLYTNIPLEEARLVIQNLLDNRQLCIPPTHFLLDLLDLIFENNYFEFEDNLYLQTHGVSMGSPMAPTIANLFMIYLENQWLYNDITNPFKSDINFYTRFLDDIFLVYLNPDSIEQFIQWVNSQHSTIKFIGHYDMVEVPFLDTLVTLKPDGRLTTTSYKKPTDRNTLLHFNSFHPPHLIRNLPYGQFLRHKRINYYSSSYENASKELGKALEHRGYPPSIIKQAKTRVDAKERHDLLQYNKRVKDQKLTCAFDYSYFATNIRKILFKHWHLIRDLPGCENGLRLAWRRNHTIGELINKKQFNTETSASNFPKGNYKCGTCGVCKYLLPIKEYRATGNGFYVRINRFINCSSKNLVYCIICPCAQLYIGITSRPIRVRIQEHQSRLRHRITDAPMVTHFMEKGHKPEDLLFFGLEQISTVGHHKMDINKILRQRESFYIYSLETMSPKGLNTNLELSCFL
ncbi:uncharacterized protein LOC143831932 [Paroedura picta]|uniref:uncharacterized protein LOC143822482 n=1 Tax=Paroedura picta TaxID=143630 RepID=UPI004056CE04